MIIDDVGIHHCDWPLISINAYQDIKNSNWTAKMMCMVCVCVHVYKDVGSSLVGLGCSALIATMGDVSRVIIYPLY